MKKNKFAKMLVAFASTVVLFITSMISVNADGETLTLSSVTGLPGDTVMVDVVVACRNNFESLDIIVSYDTALTAASATPAGGTAGASNVFDDGTLSVVAYGSAPVADGTIAQIPFTIPADAAAGTVYNVEIATVNMFAECDNPDDYTETVAKVNGTITVAGSAAEVAAATTASTTGAATDATTDTDDTDEDSSDSAGGTAFIAIGGIALIAVIAVVIAVIVRKKKS